MVGVERARMVSGEASKRRRDDLRVCAESLIVMRKKRCGAFKLGPCFGSLRIPNLTEPVAEKAAALRPGSPAVF